MALRPTLARWFGTADGYRGHFNANSSELMVILVLFGLGLTLATFLVIAMRRQKIQMSRPDGQRLFNDLCKAHSLTWPQKQALRKLTQVRSLSNPGQIFIDIHLWPTNGEAERLLGNRMRIQLCALRRNLFESKSN